MTREEVQELARLLGRLRQEPFTAVESRMEYLEVILTKIIDSWCESANAEPEPRDPRDFTRVSKVLTELLDFGRFMAITFEYDAEAGLPRTEVFVLSRTQMSQLKQALEGYRA